MQIGDIKTGYKIIDVVKILLWQNRITAGLIYSGLILNILLWIGLFNLVRKSHEIVIAHYNVFFGIDKIVNLIEKKSLLEIFLIPLGGLLFLLLSIVIAVFLIMQFDVGVKNKREEEIFISNRSISFISSRLLLIGAWLLQWILLVYFVAIELINK